MLLTMDEFRDFQPLRETYALFGWPLGHTMSPELHAQLFDAASHGADYIGVAVPPEQLEEAVSIAKEKLSGFNVTIPHKKNIISLLDEVDRSAADLHSVNTVSVKNRHTKGYNTDILGFAASLEKDGISLSGKKVLILGYGGAASVMAYHCAREGALVTITGRNTEKAETLCTQLSKMLPQAHIGYCSRKRIPKDTQIVVNGTPLGMFPHEEAKPLYFLPHKVEYVFDAIYNPPVTALMRLANPKKTKTRDGLYMLVMQAAYAQTVWYGVQFADAVCETILRRTYGKMAIKRLQEKYGKQNIVFCGFMGSGKTTVGRKVAKLTGLPFYDADHFLEEQEGTKISEIFSSQGEAHFRDLETKYLRKLCEMDGIVLSLGGGAVLRPENVEIIKNNGLLIYLDTPFFRIIKNLSASTTRPLIEKGEDRLTEIKRLYHARKMVYRRAADCIVRSPRLGEVVERAIKSI